MKPTGSNTQPSRLTRRVFLGSTLAAAPALAQQPNRKRYLVSLSFDDGFRKSFTRTAEIYEQFDRKACLNVIAGAHLQAFKSPDQWIQQLGDFTLWNELAARGHEVMPHSYKHANLGRLPLEDAKDLIRKCLDLFDAELKDFNRKQSVFSFPSGAQLIDPENLLHGTGARIRHLKVKALADLRTHGATDLLAQARENAWELLDGNEPNHEGLLTYVRS